MKINSLFIILSLLLVSCSEDSPFPKVENIVSGKKWTLEIGSSSFETYNQLQKLNEKKNIGNVALIYRQPYNNPNEINSDISLYQYITLESNSGNTQRVLIRFEDDKVYSIEKGNSHLDSIQNFPQNLPNNKSISIGDSVNILMQKLKAIYKIEDYKKLKIIFPDKWLAKPYDPVMNKYKEWGFVFSQNITPSSEGRNTVRLYFKNGKLTKIRNEYEEFEKVN